LLTTKKTTVCLGARDPERLELRHGGEVEGLPDWTGARGSIADAGDHQTWLNLNPVVEAAPVASGAEPPTMALFG
jgi:hypothetical protein